MGAPTWTLERHPHGVLLKGALVPMDAWLKVGDLAGALGFDCISPGIANATGANYAWVSAESLDLWKAELAVATAHLHPLAAWMAGPDVGVSAMTIAHVLGGTVLRWRADVPHDPGDFGRCLRLVESMGWEPRLPEVAERYPEWVRIVNQWEKLARAHHREDWRGVGALLNAT